MQQFLKAFILAAAGIAAVGYASRVSEPSLVSDTDRSETSTSNPQERDDQPVRERAGDFHDFVMPDDD